MFNVNKTDLQRFALSSIGALALSGACILAAVGPVKAATSPLTAAAWEDKVAGKIRNLRESDTAYTPTTAARSVVAAHFGADGEFAGATLLRSSGDKRLDRRAVKVARSILYPALPAGYRGTRQAVRMNLYFGTAGSEAQIAEMQRRDAHAVQFAGRDETPTTRIAAR
ncbi:hypothetical protein [uncultured Sphingomonas sp.]|uniref:energy transducer TonB n=1 Tax=uncultured Sphingomonas sp. TaxID=158754 RepID=UPI0025EE64AB|nr:hypothetical protein [uncultured Sphingomonas sp.]